MARPNEMARIAEREGKPIRDLLLERLERYKSVEKVAAELGVTRLTVDKACKDWGIEKIIEYRVREDV